MVVLPSNVAAGTGLATQSRPYPSVGYNAEEVSNLETAPTKMSLLWAMWALGIIAALSVCFYWRWTQRNEEENVLGRIDQVTVGTVAQIALFGTLLFAFVGWLYRKLKRRRNA
jgi:hypothetical protein